MRNLEAKVPEYLWPEVRARAKAAYEAPSPEMATALRDALRRGVRHRCLWAFRTRRLNR